MVAVIFLVVACFGSANAAEQQTMGANPIRKIVTLLQNMQKEIEAEGVKEKELYDKFMCFCSGGEEELQKTIADAAADVATLTGKLEEEKAEKSGLEGDLVKHKADMAAATADLEKATALRGKESEENAADLADQETNYASVSGAIPALEKGMGAASLLQANPSLKPGLKKAIAAAQSISAEEKQDITAFLEQKDTYSPVSGQIVGILKSMSDEMEKTIADLKTAEEEQALALPGATGHGSWVLMDVDDEQTSARRDQAIQVAPKESQKHASEDADSRALQQMLQGASEVDSKAEDPESSEELRKGRTAEVIDKSSSKNIASDINTLEKAASGREKKMKKKFV